MSTACTVYNLETKEGYYLDHAFWLEGPREELMTRYRLLKEINVSIHVALKSEDARGVSWLEGLKTWVQSGGDDPLVAINDSSHEFVHFTKYRTVNP